MAGFGNMKKVVQSDEPNPDVVLGTDTSAAVAAPAVAASVAEAASEPVRSRPMMGRGTGRAVAPATDDASDDVLSDFLGAPSAPADEPSAKAAPSAGGDSSLESALSGKVVPPDAESLLRSDTAAAPGDTPADGEAPPVSEGAEAGPVSALDYLRSLNLGKSHETMDNLLRSGLDEDYAASYANEVVNHFREFFEEDLQKIDKKDIPEAEKLLQDAERQAARAGGGGGFLSSLLFKVLPARDPAAKGLAAINAAGNKRRQLVDEYSGFADWMTNRIRNTRRSQYAEEMFGVRDSANSLARAVVAHNLAVMESSADLKNAVELEAQASGRTVEEVLNDLGKGRGSDELRKVMADSLEGAAADPEVIKAKKAIAEQEAVLAEHTKKATDKLRSMMMNDPSIDPKEASDRLAKAYENIQDEMPAPIEDPEAKRQLAERMKELVESMQESLRNIMSAIAERLGATPSV